MTNIHWPSELPLVRLSGLSAEKKDNVIRTSMDVGPKKVRRRYTVATKDFSGTIILTEEQRVILEAFYDNIIASGSLRFAMKDPQTLKVAEFRFLKRYTEENEEGRWKIALFLEKLNA